MSGGNLSRMERGKEIFKTVIIGLLIIYGAWLFIGLLLMVLNISPGFGLDSWWKIECAL